MKKKLAAILSVCLVLSTAFFSCGDSDGDDNSSRKSRSSSSSSDPKYDLNDDDDDDDDEEETTTEEVTTTAEITTAAVTTTKTDPSGGSNFFNSDDGFPVIPASEAPSPTGGNIEGLWGPISIEDGMSALLGFGDNNKCSMYLDLSETLHFTSDGALYMDGFSMGKDSVSFDGSYIRVKMNAEALGVDPSELDEETAAFLTQDILVLKRKGSADSSTMDGLYSLDGGIFSESLAESITEENNEIDVSDILVNIKGEKFFMELDNIYNYSTSGNELTLDATGTIFASEFESTTVKYTIENDKLYIFNDNDEAAVLDRTSF